MFVVVSVTAVVSIRVTGGGGCAAVDGRPGGSASVLSRGRRCTRSLAERVRLIEGIDRVERGDTSLVGLVR